MNIRADLLTAAPWFLRYWWSLLREAGEPLMTLTGLFQIVITVVVFFSGVAFRKAGQKVVLRSAIGIAVVFMVIVSTMLVSHKFRTTIAEDATERSAEAQKLANEQYAQWEKADDQSKTINLEDSPLVTMNQATAKITSQIFLVLKYRAPETKVRSVSIHLLRPLKTGEETEDILNLVQEGREKKNSAYLKLSHSTVGLTMSTGGVQYCPNVRIRDTNIDACKAFNQGMSQSPEYASLICYAVGKPFTLGTHKQVWPAAACFDSVTPHAFDDESERLHDVVRIQLDYLAPLLEDYRTLLSSELGKPISMPPATASVGGARNE